MAKEPKPAKHVVEVKEKKIIYDGKMLGDRWVQFTTDFDDGMGKHQKGQKLEISDTEKLVLYLRHGHVVPNEPDDRKPKKLSGTTGLYQFTDSVVAGQASFAAGKEYELPVETGDKYVERGLCRKRERPDITEKPKPERR